MTDYLEELLEQQKQEEQSDAPEWRRLGGRVYAGRRRRTADPNEMAPRSHGQPDGHEGQPDRAEPAAGLLTRQLDRLHRAVRQAQEQTGRTAVSMQAAVQPGVAGGLYGMPVSVHRAADQAAAVDAAFQRDARRYDGPLGLL